MPSEAVRNQCLFLGAIGRTSSRQEGSFTGLDFSGSLDIAGRMGLFIGLFIIKSLLSV